MKIANKITLWFNISGLILITIAGATIYSVSARYLRNLAENNLVAVASSRAGHIELYLTMLKTSTASTSKSVVLEVPLRLSGEDAPRMAEAVANATKLLKRKKESDASVFEYMINICFILLMQCNYFSSNRWCWCSNICNIIT